MSLSILANHELEEKARTLLNSLESFGCETITDREVDGDIAKIAEAILAERERCAKIVESGICDGLSWEDKALQRAANQIRKGE